MEKKVSILISVYSKENPRKLDIALSSLFFQTLIPDQIIIIKDGKLTNELDDIISKYVEQYSSIIKIISNNQNMGLAYSLQAGLAECSNDIVARADSDDYNYPNRLEVEFDYLKNNPNVAVVGSYIEEYDPQVGIHGRRKVPIDILEIEKFSKKRNPLNHMSVMFRKGTIQSVGGYESIRGFEDYYLWVKLLTKNIEIANIPEFLVRATVDYDFYSRRSGISYFQNELLFQKKCKKLGYISRYEYIRNIFLRTGIRIVPKKLLKNMYSTFLRG